MDLFAAHTALAVLSYVVIAVGVVGSLAALGTIAALVVDNRTRRATRRDPVGTRDHELTLTR